LPKALVALGLTVIQHTQLPPNDGCISLGQAAYGRQWLLNQR
jgi:hydrogenase maturation protein HypF